MIQSMLLVTGQGEKRKNVGNLQFRVQCSAFRFARNNFDSIHARKLIRIDLSH